MKRRIGALLAIVAGCGGPSFGGVWRGETSQAWTCSDGKTWTATEATTVELRTHADGSLTWPFADCGELTLATTSNRARMTPNERACGVREGAPDGSPGQDTWSVSLANFTQEGGGLVAFWKTHRQLGDAGGRACDSVVTGTLTPGE